MGQKVNPYGIRLGINKTWSSRWFSKNEYTKLLHQDLKIKKYVEKKLKNASISKINIERAAKKLRLSIYSSRPGIIIGKKGADIETLKNDLSKMSNLEVFLDIKEVRKPEVEARLVAENIASQLEKRISKTILKVLNAAIANAENNKQLDIDKLFVKEAFVGKSLRMKRWRPRAKGRAASIIKPFSKVTIIVEERTEIKKETK